MTLLSEEHRGVLQAQSPRTQVGALCSDGQARGSPEPWREMAAGLPAPTPFRPGCLFGGHLREIIYLVACGDHGRIGRTPCSPWWQGYAVQRNQCPGMALGPRAGQGGHSRGCHGGHPRRALSHSVPKLSETVKRGRTALLFLEDFEFQIGL